MDAPAPPRASGGGRNGRSGRGAQEFRAYSRDRLIESRLTPNTISMVGFLLNSAAAVRITQRLFFLAGVAFIVGSIMDTLDGRYSRMSGKGTLFGASNPMRDITKMLDLYRAGDIKLDELVTKKYKLDEINQGYDDLLAGKNIRGVMVNEH